MRILSKIVILILTSLLCVVFIVSCHGEMVEKNDNTATDYSNAMTEFVPPESFDTTKKYSITFWAKSDSNKLQTAVYTKAVSDFEDLYPNIDVTLVIETDYQRIYQNVITNIQTGTTPNVCITYPDHMATYLTGNSLIVPLEGLMSDEKYGLGGSELRFDGPDNGEISPKFLEECIINSYQYGLPFMRSTESCYVNKTYVEALGYELPEKLTWDFVWEVSIAAAKLKNPDGTYKANGQRVMLPLIYKSTDNMMIQMLHQAGGEYSNDQGDILAFNPTAEDILLDIANAAENDAFFTFKNVSYPGNYFNAGQCIFAIDSTAGATWMGSNSPQSDIPESSKVDFETVVMEIPQYDTENPTMISQGPSICIFNKADRGEVLASWLFTQYLLTNEVQITYSQSEGYLPVTLKAQQSEEFKDYLSRAGEDNNTYYDVKIAATELLMENTDNTFITPVFNGSLSLRNAAGGMIEDISDAVRVGKRITPSYINGLYRRMASLWRLDVPLGGFPVFAIVLLCVIASVYIALACYVIATKVKRKRHMEEQKSN
ncbi:MAG: extracellular solute-binding protein [Clostridia bacterium]|nr:extracellular solute-binding protein [Clostridia bacterium]